MKFPYRAIVTTAPDSEDYLLILRPEIPITVIGPAGSATYLALVDTGSDNTIFPKSIAEDLGIPVAAARGSPASVFGGNRVELLAGTADLHLAVDGGSLAWRTSLYFFEFRSSEEETCILGHAGFLDYFTAIFDGREGMLTLLANEDFPQ